MAPVRGAIKRGAALCQFLVFGDHRDAVKLLEEMVVAQFGFLLVDGVILSAAAFRAERRISHAHASVYGRSLTRLNCAGFREDAPQASTRFKLSYYRGDYLCIFSPERLLHRNGSVDPAGFEPASAL